MPNQKERQVREPFISELEINNYRAKRSTGLAGNENSLETVDYNGK